MRTSDDRFGDARFGPGEGLTRRAALKRFGSVGAAVLTASAPYSSGSAQDASPAAGGDPESYPALQIIARDYSFDLPSEVAAGMTRVTMVNEGAHDHYAMFFRFKEEAKAEDVEQALAQPNVFELAPLGEVLGGPHAAPGGGSATVILDLVPGTYRVICAIPDEEGTPHYMLGMASPLTVTESTSSLGAPVADLTVDMLDFRFDHLPAEVPAGPQVWEIANVGQEPHEIVIYRLASGVPFEMILGIFGVASESTGESTPAGEDHDGHAASPEATPEPPAAGTPAAMGPPFFSVSGTAPKNPGMTNWLVLDLEPGEYFAICFVPSPAMGGAPHYALGMVMGFSAK